MVSQLFVKIQWGPTVLRLESKGRQLVQDDCVPVRALACGRAEVGVRQTSGGQRDSGTDKVKTE